MKRLTFVLIAACLAAAACNDKESRSGRITLTGAAGIPLNDKSGARAELVAGPADVVFQKGPNSGTIAIGVRQPGRPDVNIVAPVSGDPTSGNFTLRGSEVGQPVDMVSARRFTVTGPNERWTNWEDRGMERCMIETTYDPCDEDWTVDFRSAAGDLGSFAARTAARCNERSRELFCRADPSREPRIPDFPRGPRRALDGVLPQDPGSVKFD